MSNLVMQHDEPVRAALNIRPKILYPALIVAAFSVTLLSLTGVAALTGHLPGAYASEGATQTQMAANGGSGSDMPAKLAAATECASCGTVESVRLIERKGSGSGLGAVAGGVVGALVGNQFGGGSGRALMTIASAGGGAYAGNEIERNAKRTSAYQIRVRMSNGTIHTISQHAAPSVNMGDHVRLSNGRITQVL